MLKNHMKTVWVNHVFCKNMAKSNNNEKMSITKLILKNSLIFSLDNGHNLTRKFEILLKKYNIIYLKFIGKIYLR